MLAQQRKARTELLGRSSRGKGQLLNVMRRVLAAEQAKAKAGQRDQHADQRQILRKRTRLFPIRRRDLHSVRRVHLPPQDCLP